MEDRKEVGYCVFCVGGRVCVCVSLLFLFFFLGFVFGFFVLVAGMSCSFDEKAEENTKEVINEVFMCFVFFWFWERILRVKTSNGYVDVDVYSVHSQ
jgi:hypothetical protein